MLDRIMGYRVARIEAPDTIVAFPAAMYRAAGASTEIAPRFLEKTRYYGIFDREDRLVGGWMMNPAPPFVVLEALPEAKREQFLARFPLDVIVQNTGIWLSPEDRSTRLSAVLYLAMFASGFPLLVAGKRVVIYGYTARTKKIGEVHSTYTEGVLYTGPVLSPSAQREVQAVIAYTSLGFGMKGLFRQGWRRLRSRASRGYRPDKRVSWE